MNLNNGAQVLAHTADNSVVLAHFRNEYVTWCVDPDGNAYWGHYFDQDIIAATDDFIERTKDD